jgi:flagellar hook-basal body complex protein FliE
MNGLEFIKTGSALALPVAPQEAPTAGKGAGSFGDTLKALALDVNEMQLTAETKTQQFAVGEIQDVHEVMAAAEEAGISMMLLMEVRNKLLDGYKELMRTPV